MSEKEPKKAARKFSCPDCHAEIVIKYLNPGDTALCRSCGRDVTVPSELIETDADPSFKTAEMPERARPIVAAVKRPWNPRWFALFGFFLSFVAMGVLWALNFKRLGLPEKSRSAWLQLVFFAIAAYFASNYINSQSWAPLTKFIVVEIFNFPLLFYMTYSQLENFKEYLEGGGSGASYLKPILVTISTYIGGAILLALILVMVVKHEVNAYFDHTSKLAAGEQVVTSLILKGDFDSARAYVYFMEDTYSFYHDSDYHLSQCFFFEGLYDSSVSYAEHYFTNHGDDSQAKALFHLARAHQRYQRGWLEDALVDVTIYLEINPADEQEFLFMKQLLREIDES